MINWKEMNYAKGLERIYHVFWIGFSMATGLRKAGLSLLSLIIVTQSQAQQPEIFAVSASQDADGYTEASMTQDLLLEFEKHAVEGITRKANAALSAQGIRTPFPPLQPSSTYTTIGGKKLAIVKLRNPYANYVVVHGFVGKELHRVICVRTRDVGNDIPVFYGPCGDNVRTTFNLKGLPEVPKVK